ncbi:MAG: ATP-binding protein [Treponema sp.]|nr:ATP-binding protein [Treponema sp.]
MALDTLGDNVYRNIMKANGLVRDFYETLKIGSKSVVSRIFLTGISPMMMNDLTSDFNIASNLSLDLFYNEMLGFTHDEVDALIDASGIDRALITVDMEHYYNGYLFHKRADTRVYNPTMALYCLSQIQRTKLPPEDIIDVNLRTDYSRLRRLAENEHNRTLLLDIMKNDTITDEVAVSFSIDEMHREQYFVSLLFYMGLLTIDRLNRGRTVLKIPNYSIRTIYWEYIELFTRNLNTAVIIDSREESAAIATLAYNGDPVPYIDYMSKNIFQRFSNRDLIGFDEKYIKLMLLGGFFRSRLYIPNSEKEVEHGYIDIFLQRSPLVPDVSYEWVWELKYLKKADATEVQVAAALESARAQLARYRASALFTGRDDVKFATLLFIGKEQYQIV